MLTKKMLPIRRALLRDTTELLQGGLQLNTQSTMRIVLFVSLLCVSPGKKKSDDKRKKLQPF
jgi:hypothetical protein